MQVESGNVDKQMYDRIIRKGKLMFRYKIMRLAQNKQRRFISMEKMKLRELI